MSEPASVTAIAASGSTSARLARWLPVLEWGRDYRPATFGRDLTAAVIVSVMLVPQSLAYAVLAGLPPEIGLYASILPLVAYALFGTSRTLAVGPVAVVSLMTATAAASVAVAGSPEYITATLLIALLSGAMLALAGMLRLGFLANFLSHPVVSGFITASGIIIAVSQLRHVFGIDAQGHTLPVLMRTLGANIENLHLPTLSVGAVAIAFLLAARHLLQPLLSRLGVSAAFAALISRASPALAVVGGIAAVRLLDLDTRGVAIVGSIPTGLPAFTVPELDVTLAASLVGAAALIAMIGFVESISVARTFATRRRQRVDPDQELIGLGAANLTAGFSSGMPVTGGFARSAVSFDAGAETPAAGALTALGIALVTLYLTPWLYHLPIAILAATIIVAVLSLVDLAAIGLAWRYSRGDGMAMLATIGVTLAVGVESGIATGVALSLLIYLYTASRPHIAIVGQVPGTEHFRNVERHAVVVSKTVLSIRLDESLWFGNARYLEDIVAAAVAERNGLAHVVLLCPAVNHIDGSGLESLEAINERLEAAGIALHLSEVKGPVMDRLMRTGFPDHLGGRVFLHHQEAMCALDPDSVRQAAAHAGVARLS